MFINVENGEVVIADIVINPELEYSDFKDEIERYGAETFVENPPWHSYIFSDIKVRINNLCLRAYFFIFFNNEKIHEITLSLYKEGEEILPWNSEYAKNKKKEYDKFLRKELGKPPYSYSWGEVEAYYSPRDFESGIMISYK